MYRDDLWHGHVIYLPDNDPFSRNAGLLMRDRRKPL